MKRTKLVDKISKLVRKHIKARRLSDFELSMKIITLIEEVGIDRKDVCSKCRCKLWIPEEIEMGECVFHD